MRQAVILVYLMRCTISKVIKSEALDLISKFINDAGGQFFDRENWFSNWLQKICLQVGKFGFEVFESNTKLQITGDFLI